ncbi:MAG: HNH endonuclease [Rhodoplanes sp.]|uniref:HNH endonuclease n=1 Tax=Rhodoplanes sp. TaxID=1968906 RepID=UPI0017C3AC8E|nr:HNH endonuclease signature motif containing protein [Rhodoplanes sp.]NVO13884.1 HNH endonuclease [Rhodoplanes sp.]
MARLATLGRRLATLDTRSAPPIPKDTDPHYSTQAHRAWRAGVYRRAGYACEACGARGVKLYADHIHELRDGGAALDPANGQCLCAGCHMVKTTTARAERQGG